MCIMGNGSNKKNIHVCVDKMLTNDYSMTSTTNFMLSLVAVDSSKSRGYIQYIGHDPFFVISYNLQLLLLTMAGSKHEIFLYDH